MHVDGGRAYASAQAARSHRGGSCGKPPARQVRLTTGAVVVQTHHHRAVTVPAADHRALPVEGQVPACPGFLYFCLDLQTMNLYRKIIKEPKQMLINRVLKIIKPIFVFIGV